MERFIGILPYISCGVIVIALIIFEILSFAARASRLKHFTDSVGFTTPPGRGYQYFISRQCKLYISLRAFQPCRVYIISGNKPRRCMLKQDQYGDYFTVAARRPAIIEQTLDNIYREETRHV